MSPAWDAHEQLRRERVAMLEPRLDLLLRAEDLETRHEALVTAVAMLLVQFSTSGRYFATPRRRFLEALDEKLSALGVRP
jgi:hypothetical protein